MISPIFYFIDNLLYLINRADDMKPNGFDFSTSAVFTHSNTIGGSTHLSNTEGEGEEKQVQHTDVTLLISNCCTWESHSVYYPKVMLLV